MFILFPTIASFIFVEKSCKVFLVYTVLLFPLWEQIFQEN